MKRYILICVLSLLSLALRADDDSKYMRNVQMAEEAIGKRNWPLAIAYLQEAMQSDPGNPQNIMLMSNMGMLQYYNGEDSLALRTLSEARAMAPASVVILNNRAQVLTGIGRAEDALKDYSKIIEMDSTYADAYRERGGILLQKARFAEAEGDIARYRTLRPLDNHGKLLQAVLYTSTSRPEQAIPLYGDLIEKKGESVYYSARSLCYLQTGDLLAAAEDIAKGLELDAEDGELYLCRAYLNRMRYRDDDAVRDAKRAISLGIAPERVNVILSMPR